MNSGFPCRRRILASSKQPARSSAGLAAAIVVAALVIATAILVSSYFESVTTSGLQTEAQSSTPLPSETVTQTATVTITVTVNGTGPSTAGGTEEVNGSMTLTFLDSGVSGNQAWYSVRNDGASPLYISLLYVNGKPANFNGSDGITLEASGNPIPTETVAIVTAVYPSGYEFSVPGTLVFTLVSAQGPEVSGVIDLVGGTTTTTTTLRTTQSSSA